LIERFLVLVASCFALQSKSTAGDAVAAADDDDDGDVRQRWRSKALTIVEVTRREEEDANQAPQMDRMIRFFSQITSLRNSCFAATDRFDDSPARTTLEKVMLVVTATSRAEEDEVGGEYVEAASHSKQVTNSIIQEGLLLNGATKERERERATVAAGVFVFERVFWAMDNKGDKGIRRTDEHKPTHKAMFKGETQHESRLDVFGDAFAFDRTGSNLLELFR
jgi:hypothetical protein